MIRSNDNWKDSQRMEIEAANLAPNHDEEAALIQTLPPGAYTAIVRGSGRTTGVRRSLTEDNEGNEGVKETQTYRE